MKHTLTLLTALLFALLAALPSAAAAEAAPAFEAMRKVDAHSHMFEDHPAFHALFRRLNIQTVNRTPTDPGPSAGWEPRG